MRPSNLLRKFVLATRDWPLAGSTYKSMYRTAANAVGLLAKGIPGIAGIYARNSYALGTWETGRSDIDLTVVWREPTQKNLSRFRLVYAILRRLFPMLGEVEMIDERHLDSWTSHGITGWQSQKWKKLGGTHRLRCRYAGPERFDRVRHATSIYAHQFLKYFWQHPRPDHAVQRAAAKLMRELGGPEIGTRSAEELLVLCLGELSRAVKELPIPQEDPLVNYQFMLGKLPRAVPRRNRRLKRPDGVLSVIGLVRDRVPKHVLVDDTFEVKSIEAACPGALIMDRAVFRFYLSFVDPLEYFTLLRERFILRGEDPLRQTFVLPEAALRETICGYAMDMLIFPYRAEVAAVSNDEFRNLLYGWFLRTLRYFEDGTMNFNYQELREYFGDRHAEDQDRFSLLHGIAAELSGHMCALESTAIPLIQAELLPQATGNALLLT